MRATIFALAFFVVPGVRVDAQGFPRDIPGVTVTGRATVRARADIMRYSTLLVAATSGSGDVDRAADAVVAALKKRGLADAAYAYAGSIDADGRQGRYITGSLSDPTTSSLSELRRMASEALKAFPEISLRDSSAAYGLSECTNVERELQRSAVADARSRAERLASASNVTLGSPTIVTPGRLPGYAFPCAPQRTIAPRSPAENALPTDGNVEFGLFVNVTYSIK